MMPLSIEVSRRGRIRVLELAGDLVLGPAVHELGREVAAAFVDKPAGMVLDLSRLKRVDSAGLGEMMMAQTRAAAQGCRLVIVAPNAAVQEVLVLTRLDQVFPRFDNLDAALLHLQAGDSG